VNDGTDFPFRGSGARHVLLIVNEEAHVEELLRVARLLLETAGGLQPVIFMEDRIEALGEPGAFVERNSLQCLQAARQGVERINPAFANRRRCRLLPANRSVSAAKEGTPSALPSPQPAE